MMSRRVVGRVSPSGSMDPVLDSLTYEEEDDTYDYQSAYGFSTAATHASSRRQGTEQRSETNVSSEMDEVSYLLSLYGDLAPLTRQQFSARFSTLLQMMESADETILIHIMQMEEIIHQYLATPKDELATSQPPQAQQEPSDAPSSTPTSTSSPTSTAITAATVPTLLWDSPELTTYFLSSALPAFVRCLLGRSYLSCCSRMIGLEDENGLGNLAALLMRVNAFMQLVLSLIAKHLHEPTKPVLVRRRKLKGKVEEMKTESKEEGNSNEGEEEIVEVTVNPLFPDSICPSLMHLLHKLFDKQHQLLYHFYDRPQNLGVSELDEDLGLSSDESDDEAAEAMMITEARQRADLIMRKYKMTVDQYIQVMKKKRKETQEAKERERAAKIEAKIAAQKHLVEKREQQRQHPPPVQYSSTPPDSPAHGLLQSNIQHFGSIGGFETLIARLSVGVNANIDSRVHVRWRRGRNPAKGAKSAWYKQEHLRWKEWKKLKWQYEGREVKEGEDVDYDDDLPPPPSGSFPSIAPFLVPAAFDCPPSTLGRVPIHRFGLFLEPIYSVFDGLSPTFYLTLGPRLVNVVVIRLLHMQSEEARLIDKDSLRHLLQELLWSNIYRTRGSYLGHWKSITWPVLDKESEKADQEWKDTHDPANPYGAIDSSTALTSLPSPPPYLYELNFNADEIMECITIYLSYQLFCSPLLEKRLNGLADLNRFVDLTLVRERLDRTGQGPGTGPTRTPVTAWLNMEVLSDWLLQVRILDDLFGIYNPNGNDSDPHVWHDEHASQSIAPSLSAASSSASSSSIVIGGTHPQLVSRSVDILRFFARLGKLRPDHLRQVWQASVGSVHETTCMAVHDLLASIVRWLPIRYVKLLIQQCIANVPYAEWNSHHIKLVQELIKGVTLAASSRDGETHVEEQIELSEIACDVLWKVMTTPDGASMEAGNETEYELQTTPSNTYTNTTAATTPHAAQPLLASPAMPHGIPSTVSFYMRSQCAHLITALLARPLVEPVRWRYIQRILVCLRAHQTRKGEEEKEKGSDELFEYGPSSGMLLWLLPGLLSSYTVQRQTDERLQRWRVLGTLMDQHGLLTLLLQDLTFYTACAKNSMPLVEAAVRKRIGMRRRLPDPALFVIGGSGNGNAGAVTSLQSPANASAAVGSSAAWSLRDVGCLGIAISDLDASITLPASLDLSAGLLTDIKQVVTAGDGAAAVSGHGQSSMVAATSNAHTHVTGPTPSHATMTRSNSHSSRHAIPFSEELSHELEMLVRMELLRFLLAHSFRSLDASQLSSLWHACILNSVSQRMRRMFMLWLRYLHIPRPMSTPTLILAEAQQQAAQTGKPLSGIMDPTRYLNGLKNEAANHLFHSLLSNPSSLPWEMFDDAAFLCWRHLFLVLNEASRRLLLHTPLLPPAKHSTSAIGDNDHVGAPLLPSSASLSFTLLPSAQPLVGIHQLWEIFHSSNPHVSSLAADLLIQVYGDAPPPPVKTSSAAAMADKAAPHTHAMAGASALLDEGWKHSMGEMFVERCMQLMRNCISDAKAEGSAVHKGAGTTEKVGSGVLSSTSPSNTASSRILRCLTILQRFMQACQLPDAEHGDDNETVTVDTDSSDARPPSSGATFPVHVYIGSAASPSPKPDVILSLKDGSSVASMKEQLSHMLDINPRDMAISLIIHCQGKSEVKELEKQEVHTKRQLREMDNSEQMSHSVLAAEAGVSVDGEDAIKVLLHQAVKGNERREDDLTSNMLGNDTPLPQTPHMDGTAAFAAAATGAGLTPSSHPTAHRQRHAAHLLANDESYFDLLFSLLQRGTIHGETEEISQRAWKLITSLPTNRKLLAEIRTLDTVMPSGATDSSDETQPAAAQDVIDGGWSRLLDPSSPFKLLYSLRIISKLAAPHLPLPSVDAAGHHQPLPSPVADQRSRMFVEGVDWRNRFIARSGVHYLYKLLCSTMQQRTEASKNHAHTQGSHSTAVPWDESRNACLALLAKLFTFFLLCAQSQSNHHVLYLLYFAMPDLSSTQLGDLSDPRTPAQLQGLMRSLSSDASFLRDIDRTTLMQSALELLQTCARAMHKSNIRQHLAARTVTTAKDQITHAHTSADNKAGSDSGEGLDGMTIKQSTLLLSACILHQPAASHSTDPSFHTPLTLLSRFSLPPLFANLLFNGNIECAQEQADAWTNLCRHFRAQVKEATSSPSSSRHSSDTTHPMALHRLLLLDVMLPLLPRVNSKLAYASFSQEYFELFDSLVRDVLDEDVALHGDDWSRSTHLHPLPCSEWRLVSHVLPEHDWIAFFQRLASDFAQRPIIESEAGSGWKPIHATQTHSTGLTHDCDWVLIGLMNIMATMIKRLPILQQFIAHQHQQLEEEKERSGAEPDVHSDTSPIVSTSSLSSPSASPSSHSSRTVDLLQCIFSTLFDVPSVSTAHLPLRAPRAKRRPTRLAAFHLLLTIVTSHPALIQLLAAMLYRQNVDDNHVNATSPSEWEYSPDDHSRSSTGYCGLHNISATCYLNSMMQQLFMIPTFRNKIMQIKLSGAGKSDVQLPPGDGGLQSSVASTASNASTSTSALTPSSTSATSSGTGKDDLHDNLLYQLQFMFGTLSESVKRSYNPLSFCHSFRGYDGQPIDPRVQQDVDEFFNQLCDKVEAALKDLPTDELANVQSRTLIKDTFGGELEHQLICESGHTSVRSEPFVCVPLDVKNKSSVSASLESFICGETLEGENAYGCKGCGRKVRTLKRVCIKTLPEILVLNLKRFTFDYESMLKMKLNDYVAFPMNIQMEPYTAEGIARREAASKQAETTANGNGGESNGEADTSTPPTSSPFLAPMGSMSGAASSPVTSYTLVGILLHSGGSESGHYTSLVRERGPDGSEGDRWFEFNDSVVRKFDPRNIPNECFGGTHTIATMDHRLRRKITKEVEKTRSAYLLIYAKDKTAHGVAGGQGGSVACTPQHSPVRRLSSSSRPDPVRPFASSSPLDALQLTPTRLLRSPSEPTRSQSGLALTRTSSTDGHESARQQNAETDNDTARRINFTPAQSPTRSPFRSSPPPPLILDGGKHEEGADSDSALFSPSMSRTASVSKKQKNHSEGSISMPHDIYASIWEENIVFLRCRQLFQRDYCSFMAQFLQLAASMADDGTDSATRPQYGLPHSLSRAAQSALLPAQLACIYILEVLARAQFVTNPAAYEKQHTRVGEEGEMEAELLQMNEQERRRAMGGRNGMEHRARMQIQTFTDHRDASPDSVGVMIAARSQQLLASYRQVLFQLFNQHLPAVCWWLHDYLMCSGRSHFRLRLYLFECNNQLIRDFFSQLVTDALTLIIPHERPLYDNYVTIPIQTTSVSMPNSPANAAKSVTSQGSNVESIQSPSAISLQLIDAWISLWQDVPLFWKSLVPYFSVLRSFACCGHNERMYLLESHAILLHAIDLYLGNLSPYASREKQRRPVMGDADHPPNFTHLMALIAIAVQTTIVEPDETISLPPTLLTVKHGVIPLPEEKEGESKEEEESGLPEKDAMAPSSPTRVSGAVAATSTSAPTTPARVSGVSPPPSFLVLRLPPPSRLSSRWLLLHAHTLTRAESELLFSDVFLRKLMREGCNMEANKNIITHLCWENVALDSHICRLYQRLLDDCGSRDYVDRLDSVLGILPSILSANDSLQAQRIDQYLNEQSGLINKTSYWRATSPTFTVRAIKTMIVDMGRKEGHPVRQYLMDRRPSLYWCIEWLHHYASGRSSMHLGSVYDSTDHDVVSRHGGVSAAMLEQVIEWFTLEWVQQHEAEIAARAAERQRLAQAQAQTQAQRQSSSSRKTQRGVHSHSSSQAKSTGEMSMSVEEQLRRIRASRRHASMEDDEGAGAGAGEGVDVGEGELDDEDGDGDGDGIIVSRAHRSPSRHGKQSRRGRIVESEEEDESEEDGEEEEEDEEAADTECVDDESEDADDDDDQRAVAPTQRQRQQPQHSYSTLPLPHLGGDAFIHDAQVLDAAVTDDEDEEDDDDDHGNDGVGVGAQVLDGADGEGEDLLCTQVESRLRLTATARQRLVGHADSDVDGDAEHDHDHVADVDSSHLHPHPPSERAHTNANANANANLPIHHRVLDATTFTPPSDVEAEEHDDDDDDDVEAAEAAEAIEQVRLMQLREQQEGAQQQ